MTEPRQCTATSKRTGERCQRRPIPGGTVCVKHGGGAPRVQAAAAARVRDEQARQAAESIAVPITTSPIEALLGEVHRCSGMVAYYEARIREVEEASVEGLIYGRTSVQSGPDGITQSWEAGAHMWIKLHGEERDRLVRACTAAIRGGVEERQVRLAESQGALVAAAIRRVLDGLDLTPEQRDMVPEIVPTALRAITA